MCIIVSNFQRFFSLFAFRGLRLRAFEKARMHIHYLSTAMCIFIRLQLPVPLTLQYTWIYIFPISIRFVCTQALNGSARGHQSAHLAPLIPALATLAYFGRKPSTRNLSIDPTLTCGCDYGIHSALCAFVHRLMWLSIPPFVHSGIYLSLCVSIQFVCLFISLSIYLPIHLFLHSVVYSFIIYLSTL